MLLYLMLATLVTLRLLTTPTDPHTFRPSYWIYMGATAITVLAGSRILVLSADLPIVAATSAFVSGFTYVLWAFGAWWIPLLVLFGVWRYAVRREPMRYESELWSIVFPLGMYAVASIALRRRGGSAASGRRGRGRRLGRRIRLAGGRGRHGRGTAHPVGGAVPAD